MNYFKNFFIKEKNIGIFQSIVLIIFFIIFSLILFITLYKPKKYYDKNSSIPIDE
ncbi:cytochrome oxidase [Blattabacterium cuenoti]|uniref:cytochrome oxidase n=1 Tax=Blattabacterium cuenoti TaxID=1653831 RepID=UPI00163C3E7D|nr:cytochrome oxidase [Blattabacterium cuenoti]